MEGTGVFAIVLNAGAFGLLAWLAVKWLPATAERFARTNEEFAQTVKDLTDTFRNELKYEREHSERIVDSLARQWSATQEGTAARLGEIYEKCRELLHGMNDVRQTLRFRTRLADLVNSAEEAIYSKTLEGVLTSWNASCERLFGWRADEMVGQSIYKFVPGDLVEQEAEVLRKLKRGEKVDPYATERAHRSGRRIPIIVTTSPIRDSAGGVVGASTIAREETD